MIRSLKNNLVPFTFILVLSASLTTNVYLGRIVRSVRSEKKIVPKADLEASVHQQLRALNVTQPGKSGVQLFLQGNRPTVLYVFSPTCSWCAKNLQNVRTLSYQTKDKYRFIGISTGSHNLGAYLDKHPLPFPAYEDISNSDLKSLDYRGTPQTILVSGSGVVEHNWPGAYTGGTGDAVEKYFSVNLPGLLAAPIPPAMTSSSLQSLH